MPDQPRSEQPTPAQRSRLAAMIDNLVAVQMDLKPLCEDKGCNIPEGHGRTTIAEACNVLQSTIDDLKQVIFELEGIPAMTGAAESPAQKGMPG